MDRPIVGYFINFLRELIESEKSLQFIRRQLSKIKNYHPFCIFKKIAGKNNIIDIKTMHSFVKDRVTCNERQLYEIFQKFDHKRQGFIDKTDFCKQMYPGCRKIGRYNEGISMNYQVQSKFINYLNTIVKSCRVVDVWRKQLADVQSFKIFKLIDSNLDGRIGPNQLSTFFLRNSQRLNLDNACFLHQILLRRHYSEVNLEVFCQNLKPLEFGGYLNYQKALQNIKKEQLHQKKERHIQALQQQQNFYKQRKNQKVIELIHKQASLLRQKELQDRVKEQIDIYNDLKYLTRKKYHPNLTYDQFLLFEKQNVDRINFEKQLALQQAVKRQHEYHQKLRHVDVVRQVQAFQRSKIQRLPFSIITNRIQSSSNTLNQAALQQKIKKHRIDQLNRQKKTPISRKSSIIQELYPILNKRF